MVDSSLQHLIYGNAVIADGASDTPDVLAITGHINPDRVRQLIDAIPLSPLPLDDIQESQAVAFVSLNGTGEKQYIMARAHFQNAEQGLAVRQLILIPDDMQASNFDFDSLLNLINEPIPTYNVTNVPLEPLTVKSKAPETTDKKVAIIKSFLDDVVAGNFRLLAGIVGLAIQKKVLISNFPGDNAQRLALVRGLRLLLPAATRHLLTFTTYTDTLNGELPRITFSEAEGESDVYRLDWQNPQIDETAYSQAYIALLLSIWKDDVIALVETINRCNEIANILIQDYSKIDPVLTAVALRHQMDLAALRGDSITSAEILTALKSSIPVSDELQTAYSILLLENNFRDRDASNAKAIGAMLDADTKLDNNLTPFFKTSTENQPDAVYAFIRAYLHRSEDAEISTQWLERLHDSAEASVEVAIESADAATIQGWLTLISREPLRYELSDILRNAMLAAQANVTDSSELALELLSVAVKRQADMIDGLLADENLLLALPDHMRDAIMNFDAASIETAGSESRELFLLALHRAIEAEQAAVTSSSARMLWQIHTQQKTDTLPLQFRPVSLIQNLAEHPECFVNGANSTLLTLILSDASQDELFFEIVPLLSEQEQLAEVLAGAFGQSNRDMADILEMLSRLLTDNLLVPQMIADILSTLLINRNWHEEYLPLVEQLSRVMAQYPDTDAPMGVLWKLSELAAIHRNEQMLKVSMRRLLESTGDLLSEAQVVESIQHIRKDSSWSNAGRSTLIKWWRNYVREQGTGQLQKIDKLLEGKRSLEDLRAIVQTSIAMRRIIGNRTLEEFSEAVATTYNLLQALSEGFDASDKLVDSMTIRAEIDSREDELPPELRPVLSTNFKELAQLVTTLSENRSKPSLIRSDDAVERQLVKGEQEPQSAIDVMRWLSGYLDGIQKEDEAE